MNNEANPQETHNHASLRIPLAVILVVFAAAYTLLVMTGHLPEKRQLSATHLVLLALVALAVVLLVSPGSLNRLKLLELSGFRLELLERVREKQIEQGEALDAISLVLPLLLPETERAHLVNLAEGNTRDYRGGHVLRTELRRLRNFGLLRMTGQGNIADLRSDMQFDLREYVELTDLGQRWARQIARLEATKDAKDPELPKDNAAESDSDN